MTTNHTTWSVLPQLFATLSVCLSGMCTGTFFSFSSVAVPILQKPMEQGGWEITLEEGSWIASIFYIGTIFGSLASGSLVDKYGSKWVSLVMGPVVVLNWIITAFPGHIATIYCTRIVAGACYGVFLAVAKVYIAEVAHPDFRGTTSAFYPTFLSAGLLYGFVLGNFIPHLRLSTLLLAVPAIIYFVMCLFIPNSPYWLVARGRLDEAQKSLQWLRGSTCDIQEEFKEILTKSENSNDDAKESWKSSLTSSDLWRPLIRIGVLMLLVEWSGSNLISQYMVIVIQESGSSIEPNLATIGVALARMIFGSMSTVILRYCPRRPLLLFCTFLSMVSFLSLGTFKHILTTSREISENQTTVEEIPTIQQTFGWIPMVSIGLIQACETVGFIAIVHLTLQAESFPTRVRAIGCGLLGVVTALARFSIAKIFPLLLSVLGFEGVFWLFAIILLLIFIYCWIIVPENKGQSLTKTEDKMMVT